MKAALGFLLLAAVVGGCLVAGGAVLQAHLMRAADPVVSVTFEERWEVVPTIKPRAVEKNRKSR